jgi:hypothetical protein
MADETYNGWTNRETWAAALHLSNTEWLYNGAREVVASTDPVGEYSRATALEEWVTGIIESQREVQDDKTVVGPTREDPDLTMMDREVGSWWRVDWREVAEGLLED